MARVRIAGQLSSTSDGDVVKRHFVQMHSIPKFSDVALYNCHQTGSRVAVDMSINPRMFETARAPSYFPFGV